MVKIKIIIHDGITTTVLSDGMADVRSWILTVTMRTTMPFVRMKRTF